jgi:hypothetical protein
MTCFHIAYRDVHVPVLSWQICGRERNVRIKYFVRIDTLVYRDPKDLDDEEVELAPSTECNLWRGTYWNKTRFQNFFFPQSTPFLSWAQEWCAIKGRYVQIIHGHLIGFSAYTTEIILFSLFLTIVTAWTAKRKYSKGNDTKPKQQLLHM